MKRTFALLLSVLFLLTALPMGGLAVAADAAEYPYLKLGVTTEAVVEDNFTCFSFIPSLNGYYAFYSTAYEDTHGYLYDADGNELAYDDQSGGNNDFRIVRHLIEGETYLLKAGYYSGESGSFPVCVEMIENPRVITNVEFRDVEMLEESAKEGASVRSVIHYSDGTVEEETSRWLQDDLGDYYVDMEYEIPREEWVSGGTYNVTARIETGNQTFTGTYTVTVIDTPIESITFNPVSVIENVNGYWTTEEYWNDETGEREEKEYFYYDNIYPTATVVMKDGTIYRNILEIESEFWTQKSGRSSNCS